MCRLCIVRVIQTISPDEWERLRESFGKEVYKCPAMAELEALTPGGSEYVEYPERCVKVIRHTSASLHRMLMARVRQLNLCNAKLRDMEERFLNEVFRNSPRG